ncbi:hypothetical protein M409DRAFT_30060 [Zasmidium cellare ATCC 36951]|uniref:ABM domain-containing protein n=1 Tax=Zasmidium cellare ATCC 36951 TaxID=1080233 RepID=A0A6A6C0V4_ZASCE|nr:uncharacterized protein M409DRAFT_30060 [Zasmidium cellare ATCC 36951]KAF2159442.1 hypothetical protein M409DRAFT_30060 [Zasmidium cellare ATCC 36951]
MAANPEEITLIVVFSPAVGKADRLRTLTEAYAAQVHAHEPSTIQFQLHIEESDFGFGQRWCVVERYPDPISMHLHRSTPRYHGFAKTIKEERLVSERPVVFAGKAVAGFNWIH